MKRMLMLILAALLFSIIIAGLGSGIGGRNRSHKTWQHPDLHPVGRTAPSKR